MQALVIPADLSMPIAAREMEGLSALKAAVSGPIKVVDLPDLGISMLVNEEGLVRRLSLNRRSTFLWWGHVPTAQGESLLVGEVALVGAVGSDGNFADVSAAVVIELTDRRPRQVQVRTRGDDEWYYDRASFDDHITALGWAMLTLDRCASTRRSPAAGVSGSAPALGRLLPSHQ